MADFIRYDRLKAILVVADNDDHPDDNFNNIRNYLKDAKVPSPNEALKVVRWAKGGLAVAVMMLPFEKGVSGKGCLETLLLKSLEGNHAVLEKCIDHYSACSGARTKNQEDKLRMRCFIAAKYPEDPNLALSHVVSPSKKLIDLKHSCFDEISTFLGDFPKLCG